jgi:uncharacterized protein DUF6326
MEQPTAEQALGQLDPLVGEWTVEAKWPCGHDGRICLGALASSIVVLQGDWALQREGRAKVSTSNSKILEDERIGVRLKISALWIAMLFLFAYGDIFGFFRAGLIEDVIAGEVSGMKITQVFLFAVSIYVAIASVMVFLTLVLTPRVNRWTNIVLPILYIVSIAASVIGEDWAYFYFLSIAESALLLLIIRYAWTWPKQEGS